MTRFASHLKNVRKVIVHQPHEWEKSKEWKAGKVGREQFIQEPHQETWTLPWKMEDTEQCFDDNKYSGNSMKNDFMGTKLETA